MKTDQYLTLCLEQAANSPLHYRHGCIIVRGGKVIGQGYNDYRPGFDGGALKHGRVANSALDGPAIADLREKLKKRKQQQNKSKDSKHLQDPFQDSTTKAFTPFEKMNNGGGHHANTPLSMHSEMMAIHSALSASSTLACSTFSREKPCFKLPRSDKRKERLRRDVLKSYVERICEASSTGTGNSSTAPSGTAKVAREPAGSNSAFHQDHHNKEDQEEEEDVSLASSRMPSTGKHHWKKNWNKTQKKNQNQYQYQYENEYQYDRHGRQIQQGSSQQQVPLRSVSKSGTGSNDCRKARSDDRHGNDLNDNDGDVTKKSIGSPSPGKPRKDYKRSGKMRHPDPPQPTPILMPKGETRRSRSDVTERQKHPRLRGADLYVTRLGWNKKDTPPKPKATKPELSSTEDEAESDLASSTSSFPSSTTSGSLHDELRDPSPRPSPHLAPSTISFPCSAIHASRPCYRCVSYMHSVGIKRVFWTNDAGEWEGGKVAKLVQALESTGEGDGDGGPLGNGVFVTKHEVLMLKRMMG